MPDLSELFSASLLSKSWSRHWVDYVSSYRIYASQISVAGLPATFRPVSKFVNLKHAEIGYDASCDVPSFFADIAATVLALPKLTSLDFAWRRRTAEQPLDGWLAPALEKHGSKLQQLSISISDFSSRSEPVTLLSSPLAGLTGIVRLAIDVDLGSIMFLQQLKYLRHLTLSMSNATELLCKFPDLPQLECLLAQHASLKSLAPGSLTNLTSLRRLLLDGGYVEQQANEPEASKEWLMAFMVQTALLSSSCLPSQIGLNCEFDIWITDGQAEASERCTLLQLAVYSDAYDVCVFLLDRGARPELSAAFFNEPPCNLLSAVAHYELEVALLLLDRGHSVGKWLPQILTEIAALLTLSDHEAACLAEQDDASHVSETETASTVRSRWGALIVDILSCRYPNEIASGSPFVLECYRDQLAVPFATLSTLPVWEQLQHLPVVVGALTGSQQSP